MNAFFDASHGLAWPGLRRAGAFSKGGAGEGGDDFEAVGQGEEAAGGGEENSAKWREACEWNRELFGCVVEAYTDLLAALPGVFRNDASVMYQMWPSSDNTRKEFRTAVHRPLYR